MRGKRFFFALQGRRADPSTSTALISRLYRNKPQTEL
jgi:hypothetical protein